MLSRPGLCWCGSAKLAPFNSDYLRCEACQTLICADPPRQVDPRIHDDASSLYGKDYWMKHQDRAGDIHVRGRSDLPERNLYWLNQLLKLKLPPGRALEIGAGHGGFVYLMQQAGFDAMGLELSPSICGCSNQMFGVPMLCGPVEEQDLKTKSFDVIALMDVMEHLADPLRTVRHCVKLLRPGGMLLIQTPRYSSPRSFAELAAGQDRFLAHLNPMEHTFLFTRESARQLMQAAGAGYVDFYPPIFGHFDMFFAASPAPIGKMSVELRDAWLEKTPQRRMVRALLDGEARFRTMVRKYRELKRGLNDETLYAAA